MTAPHDLNNQSPALVAKAALMSHYMVKVEALNPLRKLAWNSSAPYAERKPYIDILYKLDDDARQAMVTNDVTASVALQQKIDELANASVEDKRKVLRSIPIIIVPVAALYLGVNEADLHRFKYSCNRMFGARYLSRQCYSMEELHLIAQNPKWMTEYTMAKAQAEAELPILTALDDVTFVDHDIAAAFTNMTHRELRGLASVSYRNYRPYRLSDLEKIRVAKLTAQQH